MKRVLVLLSFVLSCSILIAADKDKSAEIIDLDGSTDTPKSKPDEKPDEKKTPPTPVEKTPEFVKPAENTDSKAPLEIKTPPPESVDLNIDEPGFKATAVVTHPDSGVFDKASEKGDSKTDANGKPRNTWALAQEEGTLPGAGPAKAGTPDLAQADSKEEISTLLSKAIQKEHNGHTGKEAVDLFAQVVSSEPNNAGAHYRLGLAIAKMGEAPKALHELEAAIKLNPNMPKYYCDYGLLALRLGAREVALASCQKAVQMSPTNARYLSSVGDCWLGNGGVSQAVEAYTRAVKTEPNNANYIYNLGVAYMHAKAYRKALEIIDEAIRVNPNKSSFLCGRGLAHENLNDIKSAIKDYAMALRLDPDNAYAHYLLALVFSDPNDPTFTNYFDAVDHAEKAVKLTMYRNGQYMMGLARALKAAHEEEKAAEVAKRAVALDPSPENRKQLQEIESSSKLPTFNGNK